MVPRSSERMLRWTSVPVSREVTVAWPPALRIRPMIDSRTPRRPSGRASTSNPGPRSRTNTSHGAGRALHVHGRPRLRRAGRRSASPRVRRQRAPACALHHRLADRDDVDVHGMVDLERRRELRSSAARSPVRGSAAAPSSAYSHSRSSRSWARAILATSLDAPARFWMSARVCSTESWRCAAISARCSSLMRAVRSEISSRDSRSAHGATQDRRTGEGRGDDAEPQPSGPRAVRDRREQQRDHHQEHADAIRSGVPAVNAGAPGRRRRSLRGRVAGRLVDELIPRDRAHAERDHRGDAAERPARRLIRRGQPDGGDARGPARALRAARARARGAATASAGRPRPAARSGVSAHSQR